MGEGKSLDTWAVRSMVLDDAADSRSRQPAHGTQLAVIHRLVVAACTCPPYRIAAPPDLGPDRQGAIDPADSGLFKQGNDRSVRRSSGPSAWKADKRVSYKYCIGHTSTMSVTPQRRTVGSLSSLRYVRSLDFSPTFATLLDTVRPRELSRIWPIHWITRH
jgi:hypothetical protein